ncbi:hypothetical protein SETIT_8G020300v2 [Setaria italica]|uniref:F-box domain-containing protein n=1 Tax=Setaria italica TaxID=4555 RepID=K3ZLU7_SETIT|nr:hypothetical protein SETIT_8G020300v2 [Setaria italica]
MSTNHATTSQETTADQDHDRANPTSINTTVPSVRFCHLPPDILYRIASKLPPKEFARTSVLSTEWRRCTSLACPRLTFDAVEMFKCEREFMQEIWYRHVVWQFVREVNNILWKHKDKVVETLQVRINLEDSILARHIDTWVHFAATSRTKNLTLDLASGRFWEYKNLYEFPFQLLGRESISNLQHMHLSYVSFYPPSWFKGFPNLRKLHLEAARFVRKNLEHMLSHCHTLEWLHINRCHLDELTVDSPLSRLLYLRVERCSFSKIKFNAANLATFEYVGSLIPIDLVHSFKLQSANIEFEEAIIQHALTSLLHGLPSVQNLTSKFGLPHLEKQWLWDNPLKFSNLRHLQLLLLFIYSENIDKILYLVSFIRATPFIEKLEVHFNRSDLWLAEVGPCRKDLGQCEYNYLKDIWITGFKAARGQVEFLSHVVENAPVLEVVSVKIGKYPRESLSGSGPTIEAAKEIARTCLRTKLSQNVTFNVEE